MKILLILTLAALLVGCVSTVPEETIPYKPDPVPETVPESEEIPSIDPDTPYTGDLFYFTKLPGESAEPTETCRALAVLAFDFTDTPFPYCWPNTHSNTVISHKEDTQPSIDSIEYIRMKTDSVVYPTDGTEFTAPKGYTADGKPYFWEKTDSPETAEGCTEYLVLIRLNDTSMLRVSFYSYEYDEDFENSFLIPRLSSCRTWTPDTPLKLQITTDSAYQPEPSSNYNICVTVPDLWQWCSTTDDLERLRTGRYATKRMEIFPITYPEPFKGYEQLQSQGIPDPITGTTAEGLPYEIYSYNSFSEGEPLGCTWYFANFVYNGRYIAIAFLTYEDDPADYFDTVTLPVIQSLHIESAE